MSILSLLICLAIGIVAGLFALMIGIFVGSRFKSNKKIGNLVVVEDNEEPYLYLEITAKDFSEITDKKDVILVVKKVSHK